MRPRGDLFGGFVPKGCKNLVNQRFRVYFIKKPRRAG
jgi:hypothetical protein